MKVGMRRPVYHAGQAGLVILYPLALILGFLLAYEDRRRPYNPNGKIA